ncbi:MAG: bi-domain-containing oxidoreductase [Thermodesulfobacteriota bacterium]
MKQVLIKKGQAVVEDIPAPAVEAGKVLVRVAYSCVSVGTEMAGLREGGKPLIKRLIDKPENIKRGLKMVKEQGVARTMAVAKGVLDAGLPTGYSAAGAVIAVGEGIEDVSTGDRVACAGAGIANHAEVINVPRNLLVKIPEGLGYPDASTVTLGAIALQGVRRAAPTLGETFVVIGLGILGQLTVQLLNANGCRTVGIDLDEGRLDRAESLGMTCAIRTGEKDPGQRLMQLTEGTGADGVIVTAATPSDEVISQAFGMCRRKGRVVLVGDVGLDIKRSDIYVKELDFFISTSYGPGRYDPNYEEGGNDYPIAYVRWTENRNMGEYLRLVAEEKVQVVPLVSREYPLDEAQQAYDDLKGGEERPLMVLLKYDLPDEAGKPLSRRVDIPRLRGGEGVVVRLAVVGAGGFTKGMHLPNLQKLKNEYEIRAVMSRTGSTAKAVARQYEAHYATTDYQEILNDGDIDAVLIATRHNLHGTMTLDALKAGKHVLVEKPLCLTGDELKSIRKFYRPSKSAKKGAPPLLMVGFNRRFSPFMEKAKEITDQRLNPMIINYRMNAGYIPLSHWVHGEEGGGRNIGEACHMYDLFNFFTDAEVQSVEAASITPKTGQFAKNDNFIATVRYRDGSLCTLTYTALGSKEYPKEEMDIYVDEKIIKVRDYKQIEFFGIEMKGAESRVVDKGHLQELRVFFQAIRDGREAIPLWQQLQATEISFEVERQL